MAVALDGAGWHPAAWREPGARPAELDNVGDGSPVVVVGTGLTMLDVAIAATSGNRDTTVHAVSRHGLLPRAHRGPAD